MNPKRISVARGVVTGTTAGLVSLLALAIRGRIELKSVVAPLNAPSQWLWGDSALRQRQWSWRYTGAGAAIHQASAILWGLLHEQRGPQSAAPLRDAVVTTATAALVDLALTPQRFTPGFEKRLSLKGLAWVYAAFAIGLAVASRAQRPRATSTSTLGPV